VSIVATSGRFETEKMHFTFSARKIQPWIFVETNHPEFVGRFAEDLKALFGRFAEEHFVRRKEHSGTVRPSPSPRTRTSEYTRIFMVALHRVYIYITY